MTSKQPPLPLTDENQRLVNLRLLNAIQSYNPKGMKGLFEALDSSMKQDGGKDILTYDGMKKTIERDIKGLTAFAGKPEELRRLLKKRKSGDTLQVRITRNQFLLNNILCLLGLRFEDLFDRDRLPGKADEPSIEHEFLSEKESAINEKLFMQILEKLDRIMISQKGPKIQRTFGARLFALFEYLDMFIYNFINIFDTPEKTGFSQIKNENEEKRRLSTQEIYTMEFPMILYFMQKIHKGNSLHQLFKEIRGSPNDDFLFGRLVSPLFLIAILLRLIIFIIDAGKEGGKSLFHLREGNSSDWFSHGEYDDNVVREKSKKGYEKTKGLIKHILLRSELNLDEKIYVEYEKVFIDFFHNTRELFQFKMPIWKLMQLNKAKTRKGLEALFDGIVAPGITLVFGIKKEQLNYLDSFIDEIEQMQDDLEYYYAGNEHVRVEQGELESGTASFRSLPERSY